MNTFRIRYMEAIASRMMAWVAGVSQKTSDFTVGSRQRSHIEAVATELEELYQQTWAGLNEAIPKMLFDGFKFPAQGAAKATGTVTFSRETAADDDYLIPAGTVVSTRGSASDMARRFSTIADVTLLTGETSVQAVVRADEGGAAYNVLANTITYLVDLVDGVESVNNAAGFTNGTDAETDAGRANRFIEYVNSLQRGTETSIVRAIEDNVEGIAGVAVVESPTLFARVYDASEGTYTDIGAELNMPGGDPLAIFPAAAASPISPAAGDAFYVGAARRFDALWCQMRQVGYGVAGVWEYWAGSAWAGIPNVVDNMAGFGASDSVEWTWSDVALWHTCVVDGRKGYWVRFRLTSGTMAQAPAVSYAWASPAPGNIIVYAHDGAGTLSDALKALVEAQVDAYRAGGVKAAVRAPVVVTQSLSLSLDLAPGTTTGPVEEAVEAALNTYFADLKVGARVSREKLSQIVFNVDPAIQDITWVEPSGDVDASPESLIRIGSLTVG